MITRIISRHYDREAFYHAVNYLPLGNTEKFCYYFAGIEEIIYIE